MGKLHITYFIFLISILFISCIKEIGKPTWDNDIVCPIIKTSLDISDLVADSNLVTNSDRTIMLIYDYELFHFKIDSMINISEDICKESWTLPLTIYASPGFLLYDNSTITKLKIKNAQLSEIIVNKANLIFNVQNRIKEKLILNYTIPQATRNEIPFTTSITLPASDNSSIGLFTGLYDMSGYKIILRNSNFPNNVINSNFQVRLNPDGNALWIKPVDSTNISIKLKDILLYYARGYFGSDNYQINPDTAYLKLFNKILNGSIGLEKISMNIEIINNIGIDGYIRLNNLTAFNSRTSRKVSLSGSVLNSNLPMTRAKETGDLQNPVIPGIYHLNLNNTNIKELLENLPDKITTSFNLTTNPLGNISGGNDFIYNNKGIQVKMNLEIPLSIRSTDIMIRDTFPIDVFITEQVKKGTFMILADNGFPFDATLKLYLLDKNKNCLDSLLTGNIMFAASLDQNLNVLKPKRSEFIIAVPEIKMNHLRQMKYMSVEASINTAGSGQYVKIYKDYRINLKLTGNFNYLQSF